MSIIVMIDGTIRDTKDAEVYRRHELFRRNHKGQAFILYADDFEMLNPLGAVKGVRKLCCICWVCASLGMEHRFKLDNVKVP